MLSHELRTPLTPVLIAISGLLESDPDSTSTPTLEMIRRNIELEARLIDDLLDLTRIVRGRLRFNLEVVNIHQVIRRAMEVCRDEILLAGVHVLTELRAQNHHVRTDHARIIQIIWNLIRNATKFTPSGGRLTIRTVNMPIGPAADDQPAGEPGMATNTERIAIEFEDTGIGIDPDVLPRMFDAFEQGVDDVRGRSEGLGLGLAISRSLAEALGGRLSATSPGRGHGSTFRLELAIVPTPASRKVARSEKKPDRPGSTALGRSPLRVLLVEDNPDTLRYLSTVLRKRGHTVVTADCLAAAMRALEEAEVPFELLISDIALPDGDGLQLMRGIQATRPIPGIAMSGFGSEEDLQQSRMAGFFDHLTKPIDLKRLDQAIESAMAAGCAAESGNDMNEPFSLRTNANSSGTFKIVWNIDTETEPTSGPEKAR